VQRGIEIVVICQVGRRIGAPCIISLAWAASWGSGTWPKLRLQVGLTDVGLAITFATPTVWPVLCLVLSAIGRRNRLFPISPSLGRSGGIAQLYGGNGAISKGLGALYGGIRLQPRQRMPVHLMMQVISERSAAFFRKML
jgi:hypothetical protein